jgi:anaerobic magnesium-protoporphyrin IX monomethyl ester cyclase
MSIPNDGSLVPAFIPYGTTAADMPIRSKVLLTRAHYKKQYRAPGFPVGIASIGSYLESKGIFVRLLDLAVEQDWRTALGKAMAEHAFEIVGISFQITQHEEALQVARDLKQKYPSTKIVIGGSYPSCAPLDCAKNPEFDVVCCAEGELTMIDLLEAWDNGRPLDSVAGIVFRNADGVPVQTTARAVIEDLNQMPLPAFHLLNLDTYIRAERTSDFTNQKHRSMELITSRGCPYHCTFCHTIFGKKFRGRSPQHVASEISLLHEKYQVTEFVIWDDTFTMDVQRAKDICDWITNSGLKITLQLRGGVRVEQMD